MQPEKQEAPPVWVRQLSVAFAVTIVVVCLAIVISLAWNLGVVGSVRSFGGHSEHIKAGTSLGLALLVVLFRALTYQLPTRPTNSFQSFVTAPKDDKDV